MDFRRKADFTKMGPTAPTHGFDVSRADFWGWGEFAPTDQRVIRDRDVTLVKATDNSAELAIQNDWTIRDTRYTDEKTKAVWREVSGANVLDLTYTLTPDREMTLNQTAFGGFCVRARNDGESWYRSPSGRVTLPDPHYSAADLNWPRADWYAYRITLAGGKTIGCAVVDHPANPPATWHNPRYVWMINPCIVAGSQSPWTWPCVDAPLPRHRFRRSGPGAIRASAQRGVAPRLIVRIIENIATFESLLPTSRRRGTVRHLCCE